MIKRSKRERGRLMKKFEYEGIFDRYIQLVKRADNMARKGCKKLKTDCWNEAKKKPILSIIENCCCVEKNDKTVKRARKHYPDKEILKGDVTRMVFKDKSLGAIFDLSTIDHIEDYEKVLDEYCRVLEDEGILLVVSWLSLREKDAVSGTQYVFNIDKFKSGIISRFSILDEGVVWRRHSNILYWFICKK